MQKLQTRRVMGVVRALGVSAILGACLETAFSRERGSGFAPIGTAEIGTAETETPFFPADAGGLAEFSTSSQGEFQPGASEERRLPASHSGFPPLPPLRPPDLALPHLLPSIDFDDTRGGLRITAGPDADETRVVGLELRRHGHQGSLVVRRSQNGFLAKVVLPGTSMAAAEGEPDACLVEIIGEDAGDDDDSNARHDIPLSAAGRPQGLLRYTLSAPICPIVIDILDQAVLVRGPSTCPVREADCMVAPRGLWTPDRERLPALGGRSDGIAAIAERAIADNGPALAARNPGSEQRIMSDLARARRKDAEECAAFDPGPAARFCEARMAAARAADLSARLGLYPGEGPPPPREVPLPAPPLRIIPEERPFILNR